jgi:hypothetical protein
MDNFPFIRYLYSLKHIDTYELFSPALFTQTFNHPTALIPPLISSVHQKEILAAAVFHNHRAQTTFLLQYA